MAWQNFKWRPAYRSFLREWLLVLVAISLSLMPVAVDWANLLSGVTIASLHRLLTIGVKLTPILAGLLALYAVLTIAYYRLSRVYCVYNGEVYTRFGLIARDGDRVSLRDIRSTNFNQSILGRIFGFGDVAIASASTAEPEVRLLGVPNPKRIEGLINDLSATTIEGQPPTKEEDHP